MVNPAGPRRGPRLKECNRYLDHDLSCPTSTPTPHAIGGRPVVMLPWRHREDASPTTTQGNASARAHVLADVTEDGMLVLRTGRGAVTTTTTEHIEPRGSTVANRRC